MNPKEEREGKESKTHHWVNAIQEAHSQWVDAISGKK